MPHYLPSEHFCCLRAIHRAQPSIHQYHISRSLRYLSYSHYCWYNQPYLGFGLVFSYLKRLSWSSLGFSLLITATCVELYPLVNALYTKSIIQQNPIVNNFSNSKFSIFLSNYDIATGANYSNTITTAFKCALSLVVAFSSILGRAGPLQCLILAVLGTFGF